MPSRGRTRGVKEGRSNEARPFLHACRVELARVRIFFGEPTDTKSCSSALEADHETLNEKSAALSRFCNDAS